MKLSESYDDTMSHCSATQYNTLVQQGLHTTSQHTIAYHSLP